MKYRHRGACGGSPLWVWFVAIVAGGVSLVPMSRAQQVPATAPAEDAAAGLRWPRTFETGPGKVVVYQPQIESWGWFLSNSFQARRMKLAGYGRPCAQARAVSGSA